MSFASGRAGFVAGILALLAWLAFESISMVADGRQPQLARSVSSVFSTTTEQKVTLPPQWSDNMVLQRDVEIPISGTAEAGKEITVIFGDQVREARADQSGNWRVTLDPLPPSARPRDLRVIPGCIKCSKEIRNVLVGDVWLCGGGGAASGPPENFRGASTVRVARVGDLARVESWQECAGAAAGELSPLHRAFAETLQTELSVPVGILDFAPPHPAANRGMLPSVTLPEMIPFPIRGVLWSVAQDAFTPKTAAGIQSWRQRSGQPAIPMLFFSERGTFPGAAGIAPERPREIPALPGCRWLELDAKGAAKDGAYLAAAALEITQGNPAAASR